MKFVKLTLFTNTALAPPELKTKLKSRKPIIELTSSVIITISRPGKTVTYRKFTGDTLNDLDNHYLSTTNYLVSILKERCR